jgi:cation/acetate symporter
MWCRAWWRRGLAAALSTADGLLLTISHALSHDLYYKMINPQASTQRRLVITKSQLLVVAVVAAWVASCARTASCSWSGWPFHRRLGLLPGPGAGHLLEARQQMGRRGRDGRPGHHPVLHRAHPPFFGGSMGDAWFDIHPISCGVFGVPWLLVIAIVSLLTPPPAEVQALVDFVRMPDQGNPRN